ncbi:MAG: 4-alpha-glucanotransferase [Ruminococcaceae bacterium]|nr:4-alpha-glucanotransferase [Oscillospiraceae bacterium]
MNTQRASGILMAVSSLPGPYGIGSLGRHAYNFVDFLARSGQKYWQTLPLVPPGDGASPYMSPSAFAGNPYFIDLDLLVDEGLLTPQEAETARYHHPDRVDYNWLQRTRIPLLRKAWERSRATPLPCHTPELPWLEDYAAFAALREQLAGPCTDWPADAIPDAEEVEFHRFLQRTFYRQWFALKSYANQKGIRLMGDIPIYLSGDSVEMWKRPKLFQLDENGRLKAVAGVPPDAFCEDGQLWGNPLYDWHGNKAGVFAFWRERISWCARLYDAVRIDHFRAFHTYWSVPAGSPTAMAGHWEPGPGMELLNDLHAAAPKLELIAEDLGDLDADALEFVRTCGVPGMKVMVFAFDPNGESAYLPHNCHVDCVAYTGTHDTPTFVQWLQEGDPAATAYARSYLRLREDEGLGWGVIAGAWSTVARLAIAPMQDVLGLSSDARMNSPGTMGEHNWSWRVRTEALNDYVSGHLRELTHIYRRL